MDLFRDGTVRGGESRDARSGRVRGDAGLSDTMRAWFLLATFSNIAPARPGARPGPATRQSRSAVSLAHWVDRDSTPVPCRIDQAIPSTELLSVAMYHLDSRAR